MFRKIIRRSVIYTFIHLYDLKYTNIIVYGIYLRMLSLFY